jgi:hypothetical protein
MPQWSLYRSGYRWCTKCEKFYKTDVRFCPVCKRRLRIKPRGKVARGRMQTVEEIENGYRFTTKIDVV